MKDELEQIATGEENIDYKKLSQKFFSYGFNFFKKYATPYMPLKNLIASKISINTANYDQEDFVFDRMKGYSMVSFFLKKKESKIKNFDEKNLYSRSKGKVLYILLKCEWNRKGIKDFLSRKFNKDITENQKSIFLTAMKLLILHKKFLHCLKMVLSDL